MPKRPKIDTEYVVMLAPVIAIAGMLILMQRSQNTTAPRIATTYQAKVIAANTPTPTNYQPISQGQWLYGRAR